MTKFAENTSVSVENSRAEIERTLQRYGADSFAYGWDKQRALIEFEHQARRIRFVLTLPDRHDPEFTSYLRGKVLYERTDEEALKRWEQSCRQRWRALNLVIKAKLEAVEAEITTFEDEFMAHVVLPDGSTFGKWAGPQIAKAYGDHKMPSMLALGGGS
jgi:hypothetical protein